MAGRKASKQIKTGNKRKSVSKRTTKPGAKSTNQRRKRSK